MRKPDPEIWNRRTILEAFILLIIALNIDIYGSAYTLWMSLHEMSSLMITRMVTITTFVEIVGWAVSGVLIDRYGTKRVQFICLFILLLTGIIGTMQDEMIVLSCLLVRFCVCGIVLTASSIQMRGLLPEEKQGSGFGQLFMIGFFGGVAGASIGSWLASEHQAGWKWLGPILTIFGIAAWMYTQQSHQVPERASLRPHPEVLRLVFPMIGISIIQIALIAYVMVDLEVQNGTIVRVGMYAGSALAGWSVPYLLNHSDERWFIRFGVIIASISLFILHWSNLAGLMFASFAMGTIFSGIQNQILGTKVYLLTDQKGRAASTSRLVYGGSRIIGIYGLGMLREHREEAMWFVLPIILLISLLMFEWTFRRCSAWNK